MTIQDLISNIDDVNEATVIYARKIDGKFTAYSEVILLELPEEDGDQR